MLLNLDRPKRTAVLHREDCRTVPEPHGTQYKPVGLMGRDGGWFGVESDAGARLVARQHLPSAVVVRCTRC